MPMLPRNQLHLIPMDRIRALYHGLFDNLIYNKYEYVITSATFEEDLRMILKYFNGTIDDDKLNQYIKDTGMQDGEGKELDRDSVFFSFIKELENIFQSIFPEFNLYPQEFIYFEYDEIYLYALDRRRSVYIPAVLHRTVKARTNESIFRDPGW